MMQIPESLLKAIEQYLAGTADSEQQQQVYDWYHSFNDAQVEIPHSLMELHTQVGTRVWERLEQTISRDEVGEPAVEIATPRRQWWRIAVAALLLLAAGLFVYREFSGKKAITPAIVQTPVTHDVQPGGLKAELILSDGTKIVLDSAADGMLTKQGNTNVIKTKDGQVLYNTLAKSTEEEVLYNTMHTPRGGLYKLTLSDGTEVWLNATSGIRYPTVFRGATRTVEITGEVYFKVAKNKAMPFRVIVGGDKQQTIEVLGTQFNVMAYDDEVLVKTTLLEGSVNVKSEAGSRKYEVTLKPGQQAQWNESGQVQVSDNVDVDEATAWINGLFQFKDTDIKSLMRQLARWYDIEVVYSGAVPSLLITGKAPKNISLASMLKILELSDVRYRIDGNTLTVL